MPDPEMRAPASGVTVRMYRIGHGDCFLLAFRGKKKPIFVLIDCGYMKGSQLGYELQDVIQDIYRATGGKLHVVVVTHEHADHVNGLGKKKSNGQYWFHDFDIGELWVAWTEDPKDEDANELRGTYHDVLLQLFHANERLALSSSGDSAQRAERMGRLLDLELGLELAEVTDQGEPTAADDVVREVREQLGAAKDDAVASLFSAFAARNMAIAGITNKRAIQAIGDRTGKEPVYLDPSKSPFALSDESGVNVFVLGPPRQGKLLRSMDPEEGEGYAREPGHGGVHGLAAQAEFMLGAFSTVGDAGQPFPPRFRLPEAEATNLTFFQKRYFGADEGDDWQRIDDDWLAGSETMALRMNDYTNNGSLVLAFELPRSKRVLLFTGDAQRGNWVSWSAENKTWPTDDGPVTAKDLLARTVFYKVGHHGSHNATLKGRVTNAHPNLSWMARGDHRDELVAMIPANAEWARTKNDPPWTHPLRSIEQALRRRAQGRVYRADRPDDGLEGSHELYAEHTVLDEP